MADRLEALITRLEACVARLEGSGPSAPETVEEEVKVPHSALLGIFHFVVDAI